MNLNALVVAVELDGQTVQAGTAYFHHRGRALSTTFQYDRDYLARPEAYSLDPALPMFAGPHALDGLPAAFSDCAPDRWGRNLIAKRLRADARAAASTPRVITDVDYLVGVSDLTRQGALRFRPVDGTEFLAADRSGDGSTDGAVPRLIDLPRLLAASDAIARDPDDIAAVKTLLGAGTGTLGGARPKVSIRDESRLYVAKFDKPDDEWDVMGWEKTALDLAERAGVAVPTRRLERIGGRGVLLLERFDRVDGRRLGYLSAMSMMQASDGDPADYVDLAETLPEFGSRVERDLEQLWRRAALSVLIHNTDDHLRNHGLLREKAGWMLAPAFDLNPNPDIAEGRATTIGGAQYPPEEIAALIAYASTFRLSEARARTVLAEVLDATADWRAVAAANGIDDAQINRFSSAFQTLRDEAGRAAPDTFTAPGARLGRSGLR